MAFTVPATWKFFQSSNDGSSVTYTRPGHTVKEPRLAIISRTVPTYDSGRSSWSTPVYRVRVFDGVLDSDGKPDPTKTVFDGTWKVSINTDGASRLDEVHLDVLLIIDQADFVPAVIAQAFPAVAIS